MGFPGFPGFPYSRLHCNLTKILVKSYEVLEELAKILARFLKVLTDLSKITKILTDLFKITKILTDLFKITKILTDLFKITKILKDLFKITKIITTCKLHSTHALYHLPLHGSPVSSVVLYI